MNRVKRGTGHGTRGTGRASRLVAFRGPAPRITRSPRGSRAPCPLPRAALFSVDSLDAPRFTALRNISHARGSRAPCPLPRAPLF